MRREQKGITLIALVITIIVLWILAGVSIAMLTGENGILTKAIQSTEETAKGEATEAIKLAVSTIKTEMLDGTTAKNTTIASAGMTPSNIATVILYSYPNSKANGIAASGTEKAKIEFTASNNKKVTVPITIEDTTVTIDDAGITVEK